MQGLQNKCRVRDCAEDALRSRTDDSRLESKRCPESCSTVDPASSSEVCAGPAATAPAPTWGQSVLTMGGRSPFNRLTLGRTIDTEQREPRRSHEQRL